MQTKDIFTPIFFIALGTAFLAVSFWVWFSKGKNAKAIKAKYKLGGMILSLSIFTASCDSVNQPPEVTCYMVAQSYVYIPTEKNKPTLSFNDTLFVAIASPNFAYYSYTMKDTTKVKLFQEGMLIKSSDSNFHIIPIKNPINYSGKIIIDFYGETKNKVQKEQFVGSGFFNFK